MMSRISSLNIVQLLLIILGFGHLISLLFGIGHRREAEGAFRGVSPRKYQLYTILNRFVDFPAGWPADVPPTFPSQPIPEIQVNFGLLDELVWEDLLPHEFAQVYLGQAELPYVPSMFHSLHCVRMFRKALQDKAVSMLGKRDTMHITHCVNYVRQMLLCQADATLESVQNAGDRHGTPGLRVCRDWKTVERETDKEYRQWRSRKHRNTA
jgi:hypothetical protein